MRIQCGSEGPLAIDCPKSCILAENKIALWSSLLTRMWRLSLLHLRGSVRFLATKTTTGIVGVPVVANAREVLIGLYRKTLEEVKIIPESAGYRDIVERTTRYRLRVCEENKDHNVIEREIDAGIIEELIEQANDELELIPEMNGASLSPQSFILIINSSAVFLILFRQLGSRGRYLMGRCRRWNAPTFPLI